MKNARIFQGGLLLVIALLSGCVTAQNTVGPDLISAMKNERRVLQMPEEELRVQYAFALDSGWFEGETGAARKADLNGLLEKRYRIRFPNIHDLLWMHIRSADWTQVLSRPRFERADMHFFDRPLTYRILTPGPQTGEPVSGDKGPAAYSISPEGEVSLKGGRQPVVSGTLYFFPITYRPPSKNESIADMVEGVLSRQYGKPVRLEKPFAGGGQRWVYHHPEDPDLVIKIYDPQLVDVIRKNGNIDTPTPVLVATFIQRDLAVQAFLENIHRQYLKKKLPPPFEIEPIRLEKAYLERGIMMQKKCKGIRLWKDFGNLLSLERLGNIDHYFAFHKKYDGSVHEALARRFNIKPNVRITPDMAPMDIGIDFGGKFSNLFLKDDGVPILIDW
ncbi:MAG TPA: hypothetical protein DHV36_19185 [Desulfobacteraceae bacterium]|mgnify:CR=1 FL=1|nr:hypothetical protein [Desulfobacteraceae bacterium]